MASERKPYFGNSVFRFVTVGISIALQLGWILLMIFRLNIFYPGIEALTRLLAVLAVLQINGRHTDSAFRIPWIMLILAFPVMGLSLYLMIGLFGDLGSMGKRLKKHRAVIRRQLRGGEEDLRRLEGASPPAWETAEYLHRLGCPVYQNAGTTYFSQAKDALEAMKKDLEQAEHFIFMEYFIVSGDSAFRELGEILIRKARQGVDVRLMYDDFGSVGNVNLLFAKKLAQEGIHCTVFNPALPVLNLFMNHRDHRKITVIDGRVGYTGGYNLADEYFGRKHPYGHWKDTGIRLEGEGVSSLTGTFLEMWNSCTRGSGSAGTFLSAGSENIVCDGFVQPYEDDPLGPERVAESVYLQLIYAARKSLYITTPYLIITDEMANALTLAARRGVDVRIITPGIPDKKVVYAVTRSYYAGLAVRGVRIFEYTPGFCHAKQILCDGKTASIGTSNLDYRSLYLHFENNVMLYGGSAVEAMASDFEAMFPMCREVTEQYRCGRSRSLRLTQYILRLFAPLM